MQRHSIPGQSLLAQLSAGAPQAFQLLGQKIVLWLDANGTPAAVRDRCCHRSAQLSQGVVIDDVQGCGFVLID